MVDKIFGADFTDITNPTAGMTVTVNAGSGFNDVELQYLYKAFGAAATQALLDLLSTTQGAILYYNGTDWVALSPGSSGQFLKTQGAGANPMWDTPSGGGGSSLTNSNISPTTSNVTATVNYRYFADISGLTANRNFVIPAGAVGDVIELNIKTGDDTYALIVIGDTGITINGGSAATEWSRLFIKNETVQLVADTTSNWQVTRDGRIPCNAEIQNTNSQSIASTTEVVLVLDELVTDNASIADTTNYRMNFRRAGTYILTGSARLNNISVAATRVQIYMVDSSGNIKALSEGYAAQFTFPCVTMTSKIGGITAGSWMTLKMYQDSGASQNTLVTGGNRAFFGAVEVLT